MKKVQLDFAPITKTNVEQLRKLNAVTFPVRYDASFYDDVVNRNDEGLNKFALWKGIVLGAVCAKLETTEEGHQRLYIMTLCVLAPYRGRGIGTQLIESVLEYCNQHKDIREVALHVQVSNTDAIRFYTSRFNFVQGEMVENYYRRIDPPHCFLLYKKLEPND
mmetsp:Transcript_6200/g.8064  ORF Transcript_6200/g.8064 Transcript_6200/m.8064 type:complete len:163 (+) Transcript_6200:118-606(+)|eukprot:CAMPEP_0198152214 /NCGR_PEP_ID=MMETSP1443-20131203/58881_1 /TAXON_ID=186043 /ORGANISM="Entomoneis sp., Strain CCMP2396" /LENGTH=162 /DNA_ID=CAMNT_0043818163 /DNA_START=79 /DNA_END=567 /DNA_ORIENTATION=+